MFTFLAPGGRIDLDAIKPPSVAGMFYPGDRAQLVDTVRACLRGKSARPSVPKVLVAPHAGYRYSGGIAGSAYATLAPARGRIERVVMIGPAHRVRLRGLATHGAGVFRTPAGDVAIDREARDRLLASPHVARVDAAFAEEHCLEVQLPFLLEVLGQFRLVPLLAGDAAPEAVAEVLDGLWGGAETVIVVSSDLSHFLPYDEAVRRDSATARTIVSLAGGLGHEDACGRNAINGLAALARRRRLRGEELGRCNSGDTAGPRDRVVGYGAYAFYPASDPTLDRRSRRYLLGVAAGAIRHGVEGATESPPAPADPPGTVAQPGASFVTLTLDGALRGCMGTLEARRALAHDVAVNAFNAAFRDPRFSALTAAEAERVHLSVSVLGPSEPMRFGGEADLVRQLRPGLDGLILTEGERRGTFLPAVWRSIPEPAEFVRQLKRKAGLAPDHWSDRIEVRRYRTESFD